jgi:uncharacterized protein (TIGR02246 family)
MAENMVQIAGEIVKTLEDAWNAGDGDAWGAQFAEDADFVTVRGDYFRTRTAITQGHQAIFTTIYKGSVNQYELLRARPLGDDLILAHARAKLSVPGGPLAGEYQAVFSMVLEREAGGWLVTSFHNTYRAEGAFMQEHGLDRWQDHAAGDKA